MYSTLVLLTLVTTTTLVLGIKEINVTVDDYHTCLPFAAGVRPHVTAYVPGQTIHMYGESFRATRHHIIPYGILSRFFNLVLREDPLTSQLGQYLAGRIREIYDFFEDNDHAGAFPPGREPILLPSDRPIIFAGRSPTFSVDNRMLAAFAWMPGNLFYGPPPNRRSNDPHDSLDVNAERIIGSRAFSVLRRIYDNMLNYINISNQRTPRNFDEILNDLLLVDSERSRPYEFRERDWVVSRVNNALARLFEIRGHTVTIEEIPHTHDTDELRKKRSVIGVENFIDAVDRVCEEFGSHLVPKINTNFKNVDIDPDVSVLFVYTINNKHFIYGQNKKTNHWFIKKVNQDGTVGLETDQGSWQFYYGVQVPYNIDGKQYFYGHNLESHYWFIQELKADGTMGRETSNGHFGYSYKTVFYIQIDGQHYLYGHNEPGKNWYLQRLYSDGTMGREVSHGFWANYYNIQFPFKIGNKQYFGGLNTDSRLHYIRDIDASLTPSMGKQNVYTTLDRSYTVFFPLSFGSKTYFFGHEANNKYWSIREVFGEVVGIEYTDYALSNAHPFNINAYQYFYAKHTGTSRWCVLHFDFKYV